MPQQNRDMKQRTLKWLQSSYLSDDSGIMTGQLTQGTSVCERDDDMETDIFNQISQQQVNGMSVWPVCQ